MLCSAHVRVIIRTPVSVKKEFEITAGSPFHNGLAPLKLDTRIEACCKGFIPVAVEAVSEPRHSHFPVFFRIPAPGDVEKQGHFCTLYTIPGVILKQKACLSPVKPEGRAMNKRIVFNRMEAAGSASLPVAAAVPGTFLLQWANLAAFVLRSEILLQNLSIRCQQAAGKTVAGPIMHTVQIA